ncbi:ATP-binding cassette domain-containing protein [Parafrigoribacterium mesophilum]|uniref:ABC transporter ATP-binding protein n=1 Tax=Parafrigoribacterium mesophilum TaxID=433646 RepID=UPI0031FBD9D0
MLELTDVTRSFGATPALSGVSFTVEPGRMTGFVGANGAGKTTAMRIILGVLTPDAGRVRFNGTELDSARRRRFGYMPEERGLYPKMRVAEHIVYLAQLHGMTHSAAVRNATGLLERLGLAERANATVESLSLGNQQRAQIAAALVHDPDVLVLDEPFSGLDPLAVEAVQAVLKEHAAGGACVLFSSHQLDIVERLCDDLVVIAGGVIRASGSRQALQSAHAQSQYELAAPGSIQWLHQIAGITVLDADAGDQVRFHAESPDAAQAVLREALSRGPVFRFTPQEASLAQIFREVIQ